MSDDWTNPGVLSTIRATERQRGWAEAIAAVRDRERFDAWAAEHPWLPSQQPTIAGLLADYLTDMAPKDED